jgi:hypothetical protein
MAEAKKLEGLKEKNKLFQRLKLDLVSRKRNKKSA